MTMTIYCPQSRRRFLFVLAIAFALVGLNEANAQFTWEKEPENLTVLSKEIEPGQLRATMIGFSQGLGVRCEHCHDDSKGRRLDQIDFAADVKEAKETARTMLKMVEAINKEYLTLVNTEGPVLTVTCATCHRANARPVTLEQELEAALEEGGGSAAVDRYHQLKARYANGYTFDFREGTLNRFGYALLGQEMLDEAIAIFTLNTEEHPESANTFDSLAEAYMTKGEKEVAAALYQRSLALDPSNRNAVEMLRKLAEWDTN